MAVEILTIGTELLLGDIADTNTQTIAKSLKEFGVDLHRVTSVGDNPVRISQALREAAARSNAVILTGGLGPTVDDPTRAAVAEAAGVDLEFHPELWNEIRNRFARLGREATDNNRAQAYLPRGAATLANPIGTAPGFSLRIGKSLIISMPGVPAEMRRMLRDYALPMLREHLGVSGIIRSRVLHVAGIGESAIDQEIGEWERSVNPTVGLAAHYGAVDIRITAKAATLPEANAMIGPVEEDIRTKLGSKIYGADDASLAGVVLSALPSGGALSSIEFGTRGALAGMLSGETATAYAGGLVEAESTAEPDQLGSILRSWCAARKSDFGIGLLLRPIRNGQAVWIQLLALNKLDRFEKRFLPSPAGDAPAWVAHHALFLLLQELRNL